MRITTLEFGGLFFLGRGLGLGFLSTYMMSWRCVLSLYSFGIYLPASQAAQALGGQSLISCSSVPAGDGSLDTCLQHSETACSVVG